MNVNAQQKATTLEQFAMLAQSAKNYTDSKVQYNTTAYWNAQTSLIPKAGAIIIYSDYQQDSEGNDIPGFKVADGSAYLADLPFSDQNIWDVVNTHINNWNIHVTQEDKEKLDNSVAASVSQQSVTGNYTLVLT